MSSPIPGNASVDLQGWFLTDSAANLKKWKLPSLVLGPNTYAVIFASGKDRAVAGSQLHANFSLDANGEYLALVKPDGSTVASDFAPAFPKQRPDISYGLYSGALNFFTKPTPGAANVSGLLGFVADVKFGQARGFYDAPFNLTIKSATAGASIYYTTNGTVPSLSNGMLYADAVPIIGTRVIRAAAFKTGYLPSKVETETYLFLDDVIRQSPDGKAPPGWPTSWGANTVNYGMDPDVVDSPRLQRHH